MVFTEQEVKAYFKILAVINEGLEEYNDWMTRIEADPVAAGQEFLRRLQASQAKKPNVTRSRTMRQLEGILANDPSFFQSGSRNQRDAITFLISNSLMRAGGLGVREEIEPDIANIADSISTEL